MFSAHLVTHFQLYFILVTTNEFVYVGSHVMDLFSLADAIAKKAIFTRVELMMTDNTINTDFWTALSKRYHEDKLCEDLENLHVGHQLLDCMTVVAKDPRKTKVRHVFFSPRIVNFSYSFAYSNAILGITLASLPTLYGLSSTVLN